MIINQINLQHCKAASAELSRRFGLNQFDIALIQEPYIYKDRVRGLDFSGDIVYLPANFKPRTCIYVRKNIKFLTLPQFCTGDETTIKILFKDDSGSETEVILCSAYFPFDSPDPPPSNNIKKLVNFCKTSNKHLIIGCDSNAHNVLWCSKDTNTRGAHILDFILSNNLSLLNMGNEPTFINSVRSEVLDLTLASSFMQHKITDWHVLDEPTFSDHRCIHFKISSTPAAKLKFRNPKKTNWDLYKSSLSGKLTDLSSLIINSELRLNEYADKLQNAIISAYKDNCKEQTRTANRKVPWFSGHLAKLKEDTRKLWNKSKKKIKRGMFNDPVVLSYKQSSNKYKTEILKAKKESWKRKCEEVGSVNEGSRLYKLLSNDSNQGLGSLRKTDGTFTQSIDECLTTLLESHFPNSVLVTPDDLWEKQLNNSEVNISDCCASLAASIVTPERIIWAIDSFSPFKSPGRDEIFPALLQQGKEFLIPHLTKMFKFSIATGLIPKTWSGVNAIFIPKPGKLSYAEPKSFRPISLMSFVLKTLEKLIDRYIRDTSLVEKPLHKFQYAYQEGKSTEAALHLIVAKMEKTTENKEVGIAAFLDIEGAFDNTSFDVIAKSASRFGVNPILTIWIQNMLSSRNVRAKLFDTSIHVKPTQGTPQGGCLSVLLWSLVVDDLLCKLNESGGIFALGYADDILVYVTGKFDTTVSEIAQRALKISETWCKENKLSINPGKTTVMPISHRYKISGLKTLRLFNVDLEFSKQAKYLGVILDTRLNWEAHLNYITDKATKSFWASRQMVGKTWGVGPKIIRWIYTQVIRPRITYGCIVWWHKASIGRFKATLSKLQRMAELTITGALKTTPSAALDAILDLPPLHLVLEAKAKSCAVRLAAIGLWHTYNQVAEHCKLTQYLQKNKQYWSNSDKVLGKFSFQKPFDIIIQDREHPYDFDKIHPNSLVWYTDGSKNDEGTGAGACCLEPRFEIKVGLEPHATVYQAELFAIGKCAEVCIEKGFLNKHIFIVSDSQAALKTLNSYKIKSKTALDCYNKLAELGKINCVKLIWVPGHSGIEGNEYADDLAKSSVNLQPLQGISYMEALWKQDINRWQKLKHKSYWKNIEGLNVSKMFITTVDNRRSMELINCNKNNLRLIVGLFTGHCCLRKYLKDINITSSANCRYCNKADETSFHILCECEDLALLRKKFLGDFFPPPQGLAKVKFNSIINYMKNLDIPEFENFF